MKVRAGSLANHIDEWIKLTKDLEVIDAISGYHLPFKCQPPIQSVAPKVRQFSVAEKNQIVTCINHMLDIEAIHKVDHCDGQFLSPIFVVPKPDGSGRFIINLKVLNNYMETPHFKMEDHRMVKQIIFPDCYMAKIDLQDAYYMIPIAPEHRKYLRFEFEDQIYQYCCLPFGLSPAPRIYTKISRPVVAYLRKKGFTSVNYLDDFLLFGETLNKCMKNVDATLALLTRLGFIVNMKKSILSPCRKIEYLGFIWDSISMTISLPERKRTNLLRLVNKTISLKFESIQNASILIGNLISATPALDYSMIKTRHLEIEKIRALAFSNGDYAGLFTYNSETLTSLLWWKSAIRQGVCKIRSDCFDYEIWTDASNSGWGAHFQGKTTRGFWSIEEQKLHINTLELLAIFNGIRSLILFASSKHILVRSDSTTAIAYVNRKGGCHSLVNLNVAEQIWSWCETNSSWITATYLNTKDNIVADQASRQELDENDFFLDSNSFSQIIKLFQTPELDLFATQNTRKCEKFYSWFPDPECSGVDAFSYKWKEYFYAFPPFSLIPRVLRKVRQDQAKGIIVVPDWKTQAWFPIFMSLKCSKVLTLKKGKFSLHYPFCNRTHPMSNTLSLLVAVVSGAT